MKAPIFIRPLTEDEQCQIQEGLRSSDAFVLRRCQILLASARGERVPAIALHLGCNQQTIRNAIHEFNAEGLTALQAGSSRPIGCTPVSPRKDCNNSKTCCTEVHAILAWNAAHGR